MGLITEEIEVLLHGINISYYENLGYKIPRILKGNKLCVPKGTTIQVKISDLPPQSNMPVCVVCDCCGNCLTMTYQAYTNLNHEGKYYCCHCANKILNSGENNPNWKPDKTDEERIVGRNYLEYTNFIKRVIDRDKYTCQCCGKICNHDAEVHHLDGYDWCVDRRTDDTNGITLCSQHHKAFHALYGYGGNTKEQFEEWLGHAVELLKHQGDLSTTRKIYCIEEDQIYDSSKQLRDALGLKTISDIHNICNHKKHNKTIRGKHILWLDEYEKMTHSELENYLQECKNKKYKNVICITTGKIYESLAEANRQYNRNPRDTSIRCCCAGRYKNSGQLPDGTKLQWMYYEDFLQLPMEEQNKILAKNKGSSNDESFIV